MVRNGIYAANVALALLAGSPTLAQEKLLLTTMSVAGTASHQYFIPIAARINARAQDTIVVEPIAGTTYANYSNVYSRVLDDVVQIGWLSHGGVAGQFPLSEVAGLPFVANDGEEASTALWRLYHSGLLDHEYRDIVPIMFARSSSTGIHFAKQPSSLDNLAGLKIAASSRSASDVTRKLDGLPQSVLSQELYETLQRGTVDAAMAGWGSVDQFKLHEVTTYHIETSLGSNTHAIFMSTKKFNMLPAAGRRAIEEASSEADTRAFGKYFDDRAEIARAKYNTDAKRKVVVLTQQQQANWERLAEPVLQDWANSRADGAKALAAFRSFVAEFRTQASAKTR